MSPFFLTPLCHITIYGKRGSRVSRKLNRVLVVVEIELARYVFAYFLTATSTPPEREKKTSGTQVMFPSALRFSYDCCEAWERYWTTVATLANFTKQSDPHCTCGRC